MRSWPCLSPLPDDLEETIRTVKAHLNPNQWRQIFTDGTFGYTQTNPRKLSFASPPYGKTSTAHNELYTIAFGLFASYGMVWQTLASLVLRTIQTLFIRSI